MSTSVITREEAIDVGLVRFWDGVPCERGHIAERWVVNCACVDCTAGQLTPAQFAYIFGSAKAASDEFNDRRRAAQCWDAWELWFTKWTVRHETTVAEEATVEKSVRGAGKRHGANHSFKVKRELRRSETARI